MEPENNLQKNIGIFISIIILLGVFFVMIFWGQKIPSPSISTTIPTSLVSHKTVSTTPKTPPVSTPKINTQTPPVDNPKKSVSTYKDGTYSATGVYMSPGGEDQIGITLTLKNDIITSASATNMAGDRRSQRYEDTFISNFQPYVVGKNISSVYLNKVSGSSLTPAGFNNALEQIKSQAKA